MTFATASRTADLSALAITARATPGRLLALVARSAAIARQRRALRDLDASILRDIGISRAEALAEARRPFWDAPCHWRG